MVGHIVVDPSKCTGCRYCELWCSYTHEKVFSPSLSRIRVIKDDLIGMDYPIVCKHCSNAPCIQVCLTGALYRDENGLVKLLKEKCTKCGACIEACSYGALFRNPVDLTPLICDLCGGKPVCVSKCPTNALSIYPLMEVHLGKSEHLGKQYTVAVEDYKSILERWGILVKSE